MWLSGVRCLLYRLSFVLGYWLPPDSATSFRAGEGSHGCHRFPDVCLRSLTEPRGLAGVCPLGALRILPRPDVCYLLAL